MPPQEAIDGAPGSSETVMNCVAGQLALPLVKRIAQAFSGFRGSKLRGGRGANPLLLLSDVFRRRTVERLLHEPIRLRGHEPGGQTDRNVNKECLCPAIHGSANGLSSADIVRRRSVPAGDCAPVTSQARLIRYGVCEPEASLAIRSGGGRSLAVTAKPPLQSASR